MTRSSSPGRPVQKTHVHEAFIWISNLSALLHLTGIASTSRLRLWPSRQTKPPSIPESAPDQHDCQATCFSGSLFSRGTQGLVYFHDPSSRGLPISSECFYERFCSLQKPNYHSLSIRSQACLPSTRPSTGQYVRPTLVNHATHTS